ncbi:MAG: hypothetical protein ACI9KE_002975 [Polyangiales bacterium]|jgi:hypothetical protein
MRALVLCLALSACGGGQVRPVLADEAVAIRSLQGRIIFATRSPTPTGASRERGRLPAPFVLIRAIGAEGDVLASTRTDEDGSFRFEDAIPAVELEVVTNLETDGHVLSVTTDGAGELPHTLRVLVSADDAQLIDLDDDQKIAGALHILEALLRGARAAKRWTGRTLPPFFCYWDRGITTNWSFYSGERGDTGRYTIELLGGEPNAQTTTDTDEHDEGIILHEFGHFVMDVLSSSSSHGGSHPRGVLIDPGLAWEEGRATWFATAVLGVGWYQDTVGLEPNGELRVHHDVERGIPPDLRGIGSEGGVSEILWDLADGTPGGLPDEDLDGIALGPDGVLAAMVAMAEQPGAFPTIRSFLGFLIESGRVERDALRHLLQLGGHPMTLLESDPWPLAFEINGSVAGKVDGLSSPAPSGGPRRPSNGLDAVAVYRIHVPEPGTLELTLTIDGSGSPQDHTDLDLELRDIRSDAIESSQGEERTESVSALVEAGFYIVYVRDGGGGNKAGYRLESRLIR